MMEDNNAFENGQERLMELSKLIDAAAPFRSGNVVTETSGTIPLMDELERQIESACEAIDRRVPEIE